MSACLRSTYSIVGSADCCLGELYISGYYNFVSLSLNTTQQLFCVSILIKQTSNNDFVFHISRETTL